jgi:hypothetical protein
MQLQTLDPHSLRIFSNDRDLLRDLFTYLDYVGSRSVKRMIRSNEIPRADSCPLHRVRLNQTRIVRPR